jgi:hypothetical protein
VNEGALFSKGTPMTVDLAKSPYPRLARAIVQRMRNGQFSYQESTMTMTLNKVLYIGKTNTNTTGGRDGASRSSDGRLDIKI